MRIPFVLVPAALILVMGMPAAAQEAGDTGVVMGVPASVGIQWHITDAVAVRPEFGFSLFSADDDEATSITFGASALFYLSQTDNIRTYVSPRFAYTALSSDEEPEVIVDDSATSISGSFGAQFNPHRRFGVFGEVGLNYVRRSTEVSIPGIGERTTHTWSTRSMVGVILYF